MSGDPATSRPNSLFPREPRRVGKFEFLMRLGQGGMATVYLARSLGTGGFQRLVAIKLMHQFLGADDQFVEMFLDEARVAANIRHPNCVSIVDLGNEGDQLFMVMDYVEGDTLAAVEGTAARLGRAIPLGVVLRITLDALAGLDAAHELKTPDGVELKVVHRDVSPQNILVGVDGTSRLTDFGIARAEQRIATTRTGMLKGKAPFMAPEQFEGRPVDRRADVFAMGVTLWEAIALRRLFPGRETYEQALRNTRAPYRKLKEILPSVPASLDEIVRKALAHNPADRFPTAAAFADAFEHEFRSVLATPRQVGSFMAAVGADKIQRERDSVRNAPKPAEEPANPRTSGRTSTRNTYGSRRVEEPISPTALQAFESRPPVQGPIEPRPANDTGADDDPEVAAALQALTEVPAAEATGMNLAPSASGQHAELPKPLIRDEGATAASRRPRPIVDFSPATKARTPVSDPGSRTVSQRPRVGTLQLGAPRRDASADLPMASQPPSRTRTATTPHAAAAPVPHARAADLAPMLTRDIGGPDAQTVSRPNPPAPPRPRQNTPPKRPLGEGVGDSTIEFKLVTGKVKEATERLERERADKVKPLLDDKVLSLRPPPGPESEAELARGPAPVDTKVTREAKAAADRRIAQFPSLTPSPRGHGLLGNRWVSGAVVATVLLVVLFVLTRGL
jgi:serine/threonine-protein kinase